MIWGYHYFWKHPPRWTETRKISGSFAHHSQVASLWQSCHWTCTQARTPEFNMYSPRKIHMGVSYKSGTQQTCFFPTKNVNFGVFWGYHHLRKHPYGTWKMSLLEKEFLIEPHYFQVLCQVSRGAFLQVSFSYIYYPLTGCEPPKNEYIKQNGDEFQIILVKLLRPHTTKCTPNGGLVREIPGYFRET